MKQNQGITLIALIITVIILLILASVAFATLAGNENILSMANNSVQKYSSSAGSDASELNKINEMFDNATIGGIPIYTEAQLLKMGSGEEVEINGSTYKMDGDKTYVLMTDLSDTTQYVSTLETIRTAGGSIVLYDNRSEFQEVEYLESTGTQYIDTGVIPNKMFEWELDITYVSSYGTYNYAGSGTYSGATWIKFDIKAYTQTGLQAGTAGTETIITIDNISNRHEYKLNLDLEKCYIDGTEYDLTVQNANTITTTLNLFKVNGINNSYCFAQIFKSRIIKNGIVIQYLIPCYRKSDSKPGMYDLANNKFYTNAGSGEFIVGDDVTTNGNL